MGENRKLVFSKEVIKKEEKRVKRFKTIVILIVILCIIIVPFIQVMTYDRVKAENQTYIDTAMYVWYNGIKDIKYTKLEINILDDNIKYEDIYKVGITSIGSDKIQMSIYIDDSYWIIQKENTIKIRDNRSGNIAKLKFNESDVKIINQKTICDILMSIFLIFMLICAAITGINMYEDNRVTRMIKDMEKLSNNNDTIF